MSFRCSTASSAADPPPDSAVVSIKRADSAIRAKSPTQDTRMKIQVRLMFAGRSGKLCRHLENIPPCDGPDMTDATKKAYKVLWRGVLSGELQDALRRLPRPAGKSSHFIKNSGKIDTSFASSGTSLARTEPDAEPEAFSRIGSVAARREWHDDCLCDQDPLASKVRKTLSSRDHLKEDIAEARRVLWAKRLTAPRDLMPQAQKIAPVSDEPAKAYAPPSNFTAAPRPAKREPELPRNERRVQGPEEQLRKSTAGAPRDLMSQAPKIAPVSEEPAKAYVPPFNFSAAPRPAKREPELPPHERRVQGLEEQLRTSNAGFRDGNSALRADSQRLLKLCQMSDECSSLVADNDRLRAHLRQLAESGSLVVSAF